MDSKISLEGMYDLHIHAAPSIARRKLTAQEVYKLAVAEGMKGFMLLDHTYNTTPVAEVLNEKGSETKAFGSILLNESVGGLNPSVVEIAILMGTKQIHMPTYSAKSHVEKYGDDQKIFPYKKWAKPIYILDKQGRSIPEVEDILELLKGSNAFLGTGHLSHAEIEVLTGRAVELKVLVLVSSVSTDIVDMPITLQKKLAGDYVFFQHDYMSQTEIVHKKTPIESIVEQIRALGAERCVIASDAGQVTIPDMAAGMKDFIKRLAENGITDHELDLMARKNPEALLGIS